MKNIMGVLLLVIVCVREQVCVAVIPASFSCPPATTPSFAIAHSATAVPHRTNAAPRHAFDQHAITDVVMRLGELFESRLFGENSTLSYAECAISVRQAMPRQYAYCYNCKHHAG